MKQKKSIKIIWPESDLIYSEFDQIVDDHNYWLITDLNKKKL